VKKISKSALATCVLVALTPVSASAGVLPAYGNYQDYASGGNNAQCSWQELWSIGDLSVKAGELWNRVLMTAKDFEDRNFIRTLGDDSRFPTRTAFFSCSGDTGSPIPEDQYWSGQFCYNETNSTSTGYVISSGSDCTKQFNPDITKQSHEGVDWRMEMLMYRDWTSKVVPLRTAMASLALNRRVAAATVLREQPLSLVEFVSQDDSGNFVAADAQSIATLTRLNRDNFAYTLEDLKRQRTKTQYTIRYNELDKLFQEYKRVIGTLNWGLYIDNLDSSLDKPGKEKLNFHHWSRADATAYVNKFQQLVNDEMRNVDRLRAMVPTPTQVSAFIDGTLAFIDLDHIDNAYEVMTKRVIFLPPPGQYTVNIRNNVINVPNTNYPYFLNLADYPKLEDQAAQGNNPTKSEGACSHFAGLTSDSPIKSASKQLQQFSFCLDLPVTEQQKYWPAADLAFFTSVKPFQVYDAVTSDAYNYPITKAQEDSWIQTILTTDYTTVPPSSTPAQDMVQGFYKSIATALEASLPLAELHYNGLIYLRDLLMTPTIAAYEYFAAPVYTAFQVMASRITEVDNGATVPVWDSVFNGIWTDTTHPWLQPVDATKPSTLGTPQEISDDNKCRARVAALTDPNARRTMLTTCLPLYSFRMDAMVVAAVAAKLRKVLPQEEPVGFWEPIALIKTDFERKKAYQPFANQADIDALYTTDANGNRVLKANPSYNDSNDFMGLARYALAYDISFNNDETGYLQNPDDNAHARDVAYYGDLFSVVIQRVDSEKIWNDLRDVLAKGALFNCLLTRATVLTQAIFDITDGDDVTKEFAKRYIFNYDPLDRANFYMGAMNGWPQWAGRTLTAQELQDALAAKKAGQLLPSINGLQIQPGGYYPPVINSVPVSQDLLNSIADYTSTMLGMGPRLPDPTCTSDLLPPPSY